MNPDLQGWCKGSALSEALWGPWRQRVSHLGETAGGQMCVPKAGTLSAEGKWRQVAEQLGNS